MGNVFWRAPELQDCRGGGRRVDVWSLGLLIYKMARGCHLFERDLHELTVVFRTFDPETIDLDLRDCSEVRELTRLVKRCLQINPVDRPYSFELIRDPMFDHERNLEA